MLIVQKFHSIHEIDPEFISSLELLLQEEVPNLELLFERHDNAPKTDAFTYFLFFGPTQNTPIGFAQLNLRQIPARDLLPWHKKLKNFFNKDLDHWKQVTWQVSDKSGGLFVLDPKFSRTGREKMLELLKEYDQRSDVMAQQFFYLKGLQDIQNTWKDSYQWSKETFILEPLLKSSKTYQDYLGGLDPEMQQHIKSAWKDLHVKGKIELGDYPSAKETPNTLPVPEEQLSLWEKWGAQVLTFEKDLKVLGCLLVLKGKNGNVFFEPFPFEPEESSLVPDELYTQYALLKFFEMPEAKKCHMMKFGSKLVFDKKEDLRFFQEQGFQLKTLTQTFVSRLEELKSPL